MKVMLFLLSVLFLSSIDIIYPQVFAKDSEPHKSIAPHSGPPSSSGETGPPAERCSKSQCKEIGKSDDNNGDDHPQAGIDKIPKVLCEGKLIPITAQCAHIGEIDNNDKVNKFFRGHNNEIKEIPLTPQMNFAQTNGTNATVTIPICNGVVGGPCLD